MVSELIPFCNLCVLTFSDVCTETTSSSFETGDPSYVDDPSSVPVFTILGRISRWHRGRTVKHKKGTHLTKLPRKITWSVTIWSKLHYEFKPNCPTYQFVSFN